MPIGDTDFRRLPMAGQFASSSGNIKVSTGATMPGAKSPTGGATLSGH